MRKTQSRVELLALIALKNNMKPQLSIGQDVYVVNYHCNNETLPYTTIYLVVKAKITNLHSNITSTGIECTGISLSSKGTQWSNWNPAYIHTSKDSADKECASKNKESLKRAEKDARKNIKRQTEDYKNILKFAKKLNIKL